jgi:hypothetical protein
MAETTAPVVTGTSTTKTAIAVMAVVTTVRTKTAAEAVVALLARAPPHWFRRQDQQAALAVVPHALSVVALTTWHRLLGHPGANALSSLSRSSFIQCTSNKHDFCHTCQLGKHTRLPFCSSSHRAEHTFDLMHLDLWASPVVSVSGSNYYLVIHDYFIHYLWTFPLKLKSGTFTTLSNFFAYVSNQFGRKIKAIQCDNGREFDNSSTQIFLLSNGT